MKTAILEIGTESLPARFLLPALRQLEEKAAALLKEERLAFGEAKAMGTPMRQALILTSVEEKSDSLTKEIQGPPARLLKDESGTFTPQAAGFARAQGVRPQDLQVAQSPRGEVLVVRKTLLGEPAVAVLARVFSRLVESLEFPKGLEWEESRMRFARPIRNLLALFGKRVVPFKLAGVRSGNKVKGLACLGYKPIAIPDPDRYVRLLRDRCVLVDVEERRKALSAALEQAAKRSSGSLDKDEDLMTRVVCLTEHPVPVLGHFKEAFLELPKALLVTVLKTQLNFFPIVKKDGSLAPDFIGVRDGVSEGQKEVQEGYERVVEARLSDARFFVARDRETTLGAKAAKLARVGFQKDLGSMADKTARVQSLARWACDQLLQDQEIDVQATDTIAKLAYADLVTGVVGEFPELQGAMGGYYARSEGLDEKVALGLEEFYFPVAARAPLPAIIEGAIASLAGKVDTIVSMLAAGFKPSGSEDPFGLRRLGNGVIRILLEKQLPISAQEMVYQALNELAQNQGKGFPESARQEIPDFLWQRAESLFLDKGYRIDEIRAVQEGGLENLARTFAKLAAVHALRPDPDFVPLAQAFKRASNILRQAGSQEGPSNGDIDQSLLGEEAEQGLFSALKRLEGEVREKVALGQFEEGLRTLVRIKPEVDLFFDKVLVMAPEEGLRNNRLALLTRLVRLFRSVADISHIQN